jgi:hypothetical protein
MKRTKEELEKAAKESFSVAGMCKYFGIKPCGGNYKSLHFKIKEYDIDISHFTGQGWNVGLKFKPNPPMDLKNILVENSNYQSYKLKNRLIKEGYKQHICESCKLDTWLDELIPLELHHIDGDNTNNKIENLQLLCPNCHAKTPSYRRKK